MKSVSVLIIATLLSSASAVRFTTGVKSPPKSKLFADGQPIDYNITDFVNMKNTPGFEVLPSHDVKHMDTFTYGQVGAQNMFAEGHENNYTIVDHITMKNEPFSYSQIGASNMFAEGHDMSSNKSVINDTITMKNEPFAYVQILSSISFANGTQHEELINDNVKMKNEVYNYVQNEESHPKDLFQFVKNQITGQDNTTETKTNVTQEANETYTFDPNQGPEKVHVLQTPIAKTHTTFYYDNKVATAQKQTDPFNPNGEPDKVHTLSPEYYQGIANNTPPNTPGTPGGSIDKNKQRTTFYPEQSLKK